MTTPDAPASAPQLSPDDTAAALDEGAVARWWQTAAFLEVAGPDAPTLLDGLCTQAVLRIQPGTAVLGLFLDAKARIIAPTVLHRVPDAPWRHPRRGDEAAAAPRLLLETLPDLVEPLRQHLTKYRLRAAATVASLDVATVAVAGAGAAALDLPDERGTWTTLLGAHRPTRTFLGDAADCTRLLGSRLPELGVAPADPDAFEADRIRAGEAGLHDLLPGRMPAEVGGMTRAVALDAGCYLGQEPVARLHYRGHANRTLRVLATDDSVQPGAFTPDDPDAPFELRAPDSAPDARTLGRLTTWARHRDGSTRALAVLRREVGEGDEVVLAGGRTRLRVVDAPPA